MALNFGTENGTRYYTSNMKPEPDEQIDALWGQNLIDLVAFTWAKPYKVFDFAPAILTMEASGNNQSGTIIGTSKFFYQEPYTHIRGTFGYRIDKDNTNGANGTLYIDGTVVSTVNGDTNGNYYLDGFDFDCSHFKTTGNGTNQYYDASIYVRAARNTNECAIALSEAWGFLANEQTDQGL